MVVKLEMVRKINTLTTTIDCELYFNDLYIIKMKNDKLENLNIEEYNIFYNDCLEVWKIYNQQMMKKKMNYQNIQ